MLLHYLREQVQLHQLSPKIVGITLNISVPCPVSACTKLSKEECDTVIVRKTIATETVIFGMVTILGFNLEYSSG